MMRDFTRNLRAIGKGDIALVGGKGANLGEMAGAGFPVPPGFCVTTRAYHAFIDPFAPDIYAALAGLDPHDLESVRAAGKAARALMAAHTLPRPVVEDIVASWRRVGPEHAYAVRSSATAEDLPDASFAGQQDTYLNVIGEAEILAQVKNCFISLFTDRAILYRVQNGFPHHLVALSAVVQRMVMPDVSGILFTADPISENRHICSIDASFGLGEALVSGLVNADLYRVNKRTNEIVSRQIAEKKLAILPLKEGGTKTIDLPEAEQTRPALSDSEVKALAAIGSKIEAHYAAPQDIEWAVQAGEVFITQSRPITSLYPLAKAPDDALHVYLSLSHLQVMTDPMPDLSISIWTYFPPIGLDENGAFRYVQNIGGRVYADISPLLRNRHFSRLFKAFLGVADQLSQAAVVGLCARPALYAKGERFRALRFFWRIFPYLRRVGANLFFRRPEGASKEAIKISDAYVARTKADIASAASLDAKLDTALNALQGVLPEAGKFIPRLAAGMAAQQIVRRLAGADNALRLDGLERGMIGNVVTEMNLSIGDLADKARASGALLQALKTKDKSVAARLALAAKTEPEFGRAWAGFLQTYGARGPSEIDASRPRWREDPSSLLQMVIGMTAQESPGAHRAHYNALIHKAEQAAAEIPKHVGWHKRALVRRMIRVARNLGPLREHHKFLMVRVLYEVKNVVLEIGQDLAENGVFEAADDIWFLDVPEIRQALATGKPQTQLVARRQQAFAQNAKRSPPRVMTSEGEIPQPDLALEGAPDGALIGSPVSAGEVEGVAHVVADPATETLLPGEILVAPFTDPGWTPLFVNAAALVTEVGGLMTHGSVVAREYGIPAVVGVRGATQSIKTGDRLRVNGKAGYVEIISGAQP